MSTDENYQCSLSKVAFDWLFFIKAVDNKDCQSGLRLAFC